ncbi:hypothetical protein CRE_28895 [Caenorhabditis remanei]|uniref:Integrase catalytic domain-containing protein n=1 Tax=Caenorhabditis remanei TaxID=31234 RepID=E3MXE0_CAERE|nr:hypothetical protein CRE_28895 [Caenorhabditis remanei]
MYMRYGYEDGKFQSRLIFAKSKIRPSNSGPEFTIPRMELMSMKIATNAAVNITKELHIKLDNVVFWSDSTCCLYWILSKVNNDRGSIWVANRVNKIHKNLAELRDLSPQLRYVSTDKNPADIATRGCSLEELKVNRLWSHGPKFLEETEESWPKKLEGTLADPYAFREYAINLGIIKKTDHVKVNTPTPTIYESIVPYNRTNNISKMTIWMAKVMDFVCQLVKRRNKRSPKQPILFQGRMKEYNEAIEAREADVRLKLAKKFIIRDHYVDAERRLKAVPPTEFYPILHEDGTWRYQTRFHAAEDQRLTPEMKLPTIIISEHPLAKLLVMESHQKLKHQGVQDLVCDVQQRYWMKNLITIAREVRRTCATCRRKHAKPFKYDYTRILPQSRTTMIAPFKFIGLDYIGPLQYKRSSGCGKIWILLVTCLVTRAVHLEVVTDHTTLGFLNAVKRVFARRGVPSHILSDNAPEFKLGYTMINQDLRTLVNRDNNLTSFIAQNEITIKLITPLSPWQGGIYERLVALVKNILTKELGKEIRPFLEMETLVIEAEAIINSRPITPNKRDGNDTKAIRPVDFLNPDACLSLPESTEEIVTRFKTGETERITRQLLGNLGRVKEHLWDTFAKSYFQSLRDVHLTKMPHSKNYPKQGQLVFVDLPTTKSRQHWPIGRIISISRSLDNKPRSAMVKLGNKILEKPINQLYPLEDPGVFDEETDGKITVPEAESSRSTILQQEDKQPEQSTAPEKPKRGRPRKVVNAEVPEDVPKLNQETLNKKSRKINSRHPDEKPMKGGHQDISERTKRYLRRTTKEAGPSEKQTTSTSLHSVDLPPPECRGYTSLDISST